MMLRVSEKDLESVSLSPAEVSALLEVPERRGRKEIEHGLLPSPPVAGGGEGDTRRGLSVPEGGGHRIREALCPRLSLGRSAT